MTRIESIYEQPIRFPTVSFCPSKVNFFNNKSIGTIFTNCSFSLDPSCMLNAGNFFEEFYTETNGKCYRFNAGQNITGHSIPILNSTIGGRDDSLYMWLNQSTGLVVWIHDVQSPPKIESYNSYNGIMYYASAGFSTQLILNKIVENRLGSPYHDCFEDVNTFTLNKTIINYILLNWIRKI